MRKILFILFASIFILVESQIRIKSPREIRNKFRNGEMGVECINCAKLTNIIEIPAHLYYSPKCAPFATIDFNDDKPAIALIERPEFNDFIRPSNTTEDCLFNMYDHINYLQSNGFKMVLVIIEASKEKIRESLLDFYLWDDVTIPVVIVSKEEVDLFMTDLQNNQTNKERIEVEVDKRLLYADTIKLDGWVVQDVDLKPILNTLNQFDKEIKEKMITFEPHYETFDFPWKEYLNAEQCICDYKYCQLWGYNATKSLNQHLIQTCIYEHGNSELGKNPNLYLAYMNEYYAQMNNTDFSPKSILENKLNINYATIEQCVQNSFNPQLKDISQCTATYTNRILDKNKLGYLTNKQTLYINDKPLRVNMSPQYLKELICSMLGHKHIDACQGIIRPNDEGSWTLIIVIVTIILVVNLIIFFLCRRYTTKRLHERIDEKEISDKVNTFIVNYSKFKDSSS